MDVVNSEFFIPYLKDSFISWYVILMSANQKCYPFKQSFMNLPLQRQNNYTTKRIKVMNNENLI